MTLKEHYNTYEKASALIDGGNMASCWSDNEYDYEKQDFVKRDPQPEFYGGDKEAPILSKNFDEFTRIDCWQEFSYVFVKDRWEGYAISHKWNDDFSEMTQVNVKGIEIPNPQTV